VKTSSLITALSLVSSVVLLCVAILLGTYEGPNQAFPYGQYFVPGVAAGITIAIFSFIFNISSSWIRNIDACRKELVRVTLGSASSALGVSLVGLFSLFFVLLEEDQSTRCYGGCPVLLPFYQSQYELYSVLIATGLALIGLGVWFIIRSRPVGPRSRLERNQDSRVERTTC